MAFRRAQQRLKVLRKPLSIDRDVGARSPAVEDVMAQVGFGRHHERFAINNSGHFDTAPRDQRRYNSNTSLTPQSSAMGKVETYNTQTNDLFETERDEVEVATPDGCATKAAKAPASRMSRLTILLIMRIQRQNKAAYTWAQLKWWRAFLQLKLACVPGAAEVQLSSMDTSLLKMSPFDVDHSVADSYPKWAIHPQGPFRMMWDIAQILVLCYVSVMVPLRVAFNVPAMGASYVLEVIFDLYFLADIYVNMRTGFYSDDELVMDLSKIRKHYLVSWFPIDLVAIVPFDFAMRAMNGTIRCSFVPSLYDCEQVHVDSHAGSLFRMLRLFRTFRLLKLLKLLKTKAILEHFSESMVNYQWAVMMVQLIVMLYFVGHFMACMYYYFSTSQWHTERERDLLADPDSGFSTWFQAQGWVHDNDSDAILSNYDVTERYLTALYWAFQTVTTVGYGDVGARTQVERVVACVGMILGGCMFSYLISNLLAAMTTDTPSRIAAEKVQEISNYLRSVELPPALSVKVMQFYRRQAMVSNRESQVLEGLPTDLRAACVLHSYGRAVLKMPLFKRKSRVFLLEFCTHLAPVTFPRNSSLYMKGEFGTVVYFLPDEDNDKKIEVVLPYAHVPNVPNVPDTDQDDDEPWLVERVAASMGPEHDEVFTALERVTEGVTTPDPATPDAAASSPRRMHPSLSASYSARGVERRGVYVPGGSYFGENIVSGIQTRLEQMLANRTVDLLYIEGNDLMAILQSYPKVLSEIQNTLLKRMQWVCTPAEVEMVQHTLQGIQLRNALNLNEPEFSSRTNAAPLTQSSPSVQAKDVQVLSHSSSEGVTKLHLQIEVPGANTPMDLKLELGAPSLST